MSITPGALCNFVKSSLTWLEPHSGQPGCDLDLLPNMSQSLSQEPAAKLVWSSPKKTKQIRVSNNNK